MYLQSLEIIGFKSFAQKTILNFPRGVTAVVGPNGCGKSNVLDSIRWVLGEQSAKALRGGEMADVIFSGTDSRPALGMAEVSMTFADCEQDLQVPWNEVRITRRVFRDGASEYLLNKAPCRLRDIQQLFMDTGIGRSAYSIMEQGKIDSILSSKPEERRAIFEEAAGITKFKSQRKEALRKLEYTDANLLRLNDVLKEVKRQIGSLQRQAGKARRFQAMQTDLRVLEMHWGRHQFEELEASAAEAAAEVARIEAALLEHAAQVEAEEGELAEHRRGAEKLEGELNAARQLVQEIRGRIVNAQHRITHHQEKISEFAELIARYELEIAGAEEKLRTQEMQIAATDTEIGHIGEALTHEQQRLELKNTEANAARVRRADAERAAQSGFNEIATLENRRQSLRREVDSLRAQSTRDEERLSDVRAELDQLEPEQQRIEEERRAANERLEASQLALDSRQRETHELEGELRDLRSRREAIEQRHAAASRHLAGLESRLQVLQQLNQEGEGFSEGTQAVLRGLDQPEMIRAALEGTLANHLEVDSEFIPAIEAALGQSLQAILVKDEAVALEILATLTAKKLGRATLILPGGPFTPRTDRPTLPEGTLGWALDRVRVDEAAGPLLRELLAEVVLVPDLATALRAQAALAAPLRWITLTGELLTPPRFLHGGQAAKKSQSLLQRKAQIAELAREAEASRAEIAGIAHERGQALGEIEDRQNQLQELRLEAQQLNQLCATVRGELTHHERASRNATQTLQSLNWESDNLTQRLDGITERMATLEHDSAAGEAEIVARQQEFTLLQSQLETARADEARLGTELNELRIRVATERQRQESLRHQRAPMATRLQELQDLIARRADEIATYRERSAGAHADIQQIEAELAQATNRVGEADVQVTDLVAERTTLLASVETREKDLRTLRRQAAEAQDQRSRQELKRAQLQLRLENVAEHLQRRYQLEVREFRPDSYALQVTLRDQSKRARPEEKEAVEDTQSAPPEPTETAEAAPGLDWARIESLVRELSERLDALGPVNVDAIQEYDELEQRHTFLENQLADLVKSKTELLDVIAKINQTTKKLFSETFEKVRVNFQEMFTELFGGGQANLLLADESDPLESGIEIVAKPPGKQLQSVSLLSGGERTMTAVALLFSIYMVKPSPFCVLDEMDAPLDESNINRFIKILDRFVAQSQFIVITHNKRTIAKADVLYGVTMEEHGVSKLVGVRLGKREDANGRPDVLADSTAPAATIPSIAETFGRTDELYSESQRAG